MGADKTSDASTKDTASNAIEGRHVSFLRSSALMALGTLTSRILGFIRTAMLIAAIGSAAGGVSAAFSIANTMPNNVYNFLAAGVVDAVLVPQIVRAFKSRSGSDYINRLLTLAGTIIFMFTVLAMILSPLLVMVLAPSFDTTARNLTIAFTILCLPQILFYGLYNLLGELLNASRVFGPYMWAPAINSLISIIGLGIFLFIWGPSPNVFPIEKLTAPQFWMIGLTATIGVIFQALFLLIPVRRAGIKIRPDFHFRGNSFRSISHVAGWTFATLGVSQLGYLSSANIATLADQWARTHDVILAGYTSYTAAFMVFMVPQGLISVSVATALFTRISEGAADGNHKLVAQCYHRGVNITSVLNILATVILMVAAIPAMQVILPTYEGEVVRSYGLVLLAFAPGLIAMGTLLMSQRLFYAYEDAKPVFLMGVVPTIIQIIVGWSLYALTDAYWWTIGAAAAESVCRIVQAVVSLFWVAKKVRGINPGAVVARHLMFFIAAFGSLLAGWLTIHLLGPDTPIDSTMLRWSVALLKVIVVTIVCTALFLGIMRFIDPTTTRRALSLLKAHLPFMNGRSQQDAAVDNSVHDDDAHTDSPDTVAIPYTHKENASPELPAGDAVDPGLPDGSSVPLPSTIKSSALTLDSVPPPPIPSVGPAFETPHLQTIPAPSSFQELTDAPETSTQDTRNQNTPVSKPKHFNPTAPTVILAILLVAGGLFWSIRTLRTPSGFGFSTLSEGRGAQSSAQSSQPQSASAQSKKHQLTPPKIVSVDVHSWRDDGGDSEDSAVNTFDGNPDTSWHSRFYDINSFNQNEEVALTVRLEKPALVSKITITMDPQTRGGELVLKSVDPNNPRKGPVLAKTTMSPVTTITLPKPVEASAMSLLFEHMPTSRDGRAQAWVYDIKAE